MDQPSSILQSRKFWLMLVDVVVSLATYFIGKYLNPEIGNDVLFLIGSLQPVVLLVISSITLQNTAAIRAAGDIKSAALYMEQKAPISSSDVA